MINVIGLGYNGGGILVTDNIEHYHEMSHAVNPFGNGKACPRIVAKLK